MGADFGQLQSKKVDTAEFTFWDIVGEPKLVVRHAGESNKPYFNEMLRQADHVAKRKLKLSVELVQQNRNRDRELYPMHVVVGWKDVKDAAGKIVPYSKDDCAAFLRAIDDEQFDALREFCRDAANFRARADAEAAAGNS